MKITDQFIGNLRDLADRVEHAIEMIDGCHTNEVYFYCPIGTAAPLDVGRNNIIVLNNGKRIDLFVNGIELRLKRAIFGKSVDEVCPGYRVDFDLFCGQSPTKHWFDVMHQSHREAVLVSAELNVWG